MSKHSHNHQRRREQFVRRSSSRRPLSWNAVIVAAAVVFLGVAVFSVTRGTTISPPSVGTAQTGRDFEATLAGLDGHRARFFDYTTGAGARVRFFVIKSSDGVIRAAADACTVCYRERKGYRQEGDAMVCNNCGKAFPSVDVNVVTGGCNPIPLERSADGDRVVVRAAALEQAAMYF